MATKISGKQIDLTSFDTDDVGEGSNNLYFTVARSRAAVSAAQDLQYSDGVFSVTTYKTSDFNTDFNGKDTDDLGEGTNNLYYTEARFTTSFGNKSTSNLSEGTNLYYTATRGEAMFDSKLAAADTGDLAEGSNLYYTDSRVGTALAALGTQTIGASTSTITFGDDVVITGNLTISGEQNVVLSNNVNIGDAVITLNSDLASDATPSENAGFIVERGNATDAQIIWDETNDGWSFGLVGNMEPFLTMGDFSAGDGLDYDSGTGEFSVDNGGIVADMLNQQSGSEAVVAQAIRNNAIIASKIKIESVGTGISSSDVTNGYVDFADANDPTIYADSAFIVDQAHALTAVYLNGLKLNLDGSTGSSLGSNVDATIGQNNNKLRLYLDTDLITDGDSLEVVLMFSN